MKYTKNSQALGLGELERSRLSQLLSDTKAVISVTNAADIWKVDRSHAAKLLSLYQKKGWLRRIVRGMYIEVPLSSPTLDVVPEEPFVIAEKLFSPCYIAGTNAANYWDLTEQIFQSVTVMTQRLIPSRKKTIAGTEYLLHTIKPTYFFGLKTVWVNGMKVKISDPTRTILDMVMYPQFCGGIRFVEEVLKNYFHSSHKNVGLLIEYLEKITNGAAIKRLGYLVEKNFPEEKNLLEFCKKHLTQGYVMLESSLDCNKVVTRWRLRVPENWKGKSRD